MAVRDPYADIEMLISTRTPIIVDGGANEGQTIEKFQERYPSSRIHAFEPIPYLTTRLKEKFDDGVTVHQNALGESRATKTFNIYVDDQWASIYEPGEMANSPCGFNTEIQETVNVDVVPLDEVVDRADILKLDLQGYEMNALRGSTSILQSVQIVYLEVEFVHLYDDQSLFADIDEFLRNHGFRLFNLYNLNTQQSGQLTSGEAIYVDTSSFPHE